MGDIDEIRRIEPPVATVPVNYRISRPTPIPVTDNDVPEVIIGRIVDAKHEQLLPPTVATSGAPRPHSADEFV